MKHCVRCFALSKCWEQEGGRAGRKGNGRWRRNERHKRTHPPHLRNFRQYKEKESADSQIKETKYAKKVAQKFERTSCLGLWFSARVNEGSVGFFSMNKESDVFPNLQRWSFAKRLLKKMFYAHCQPIFASIYGVAKKTTTPLKTQCK